MDLFRNEYIKFSLLFLTIIVLTAPEVKAAGEACDTLSPGYCALDISLSRGSEAECELQEIDAGSAARATWGEDQRYCWYTPRALSVPPPPPTKVDCGKCNDWTNDVCTGSGVSGNTWYPIYEYRTQVVALVTACNWWEKCGITGGGLPGGGVEGCVCKDVNDEPGFCQVSNCPGWENWDAARCAGSSNPWADDVADVGAAVSPPYVANTNNNPSGQDRTCWCLDCPDGMVYDSVTDDCIPPVCDSQACGSPVSEICKCGTDTCSAGELCCAQQNQCYDASSEADVCRYDCECSDTCGANLNLPCYCG